MPRLEIDMLSKPRLILTTLLLALIALPGLAQDVPVETYTLANGMTVILHQDHTLPRVSVNLWIAVGSKDEPAGRSGFAHLFEHLMFMGTERVPDNSFDLIIEGGGGSNNASTGADRTNYMSWGPASLLPSLLWLDADRLDALGQSITQEKLDAQRDVVLSELSERYENTPYGVASLIIPKALYPEDHPYYDPIIGTAEDLKAATLEDVKTFFASYYVPGNASLVIAGDFDLQAVKQLVDETFGTVPVRPMPSHQTAAPVKLEGEVRRLAVDRVESPRLYLVWHAPPAFSEGDAEIDMVTSILADGQSSRLYKRLVIEEHLAREVEAFLYAKQLGSEVRIIITAAAGADLERIKRITLEEIEILQEEGPTETELNRVTATVESDMLKKMESLHRRAAMLNRYRHFYGEANSFARDLERYSAVTAGSIKTWCRQVLGEGRLDLRVLPQGEASPEASLDQRPEPMPERDFQPPVPETFTLANGTPVHLAARPGTGLFSGTLVLDGGERLVQADQAGLANLVAAMLNAGAGGKDTATFADATATLGAEISAEAANHHISVAMNGLSSRFEPTLDLFTDVILRPNLNQEDFDREKSLVLDEIRSRTEHPTRVALTSSSILLLGRDKPTGRPVEGYSSTVDPLTLSQLKSAMPTLLNPANATFIFTGDIKAEALKAALDARLNGWKATAKAPQPEAPLTALAEQQIVLIDRPQAPQSVLLMIRPLESPASQVERSAREVLQIVFGGSFTSRLNQNIREEHGYSYGAGAGYMRRGNQYLLWAFAPVQAEFTGAALNEFKNEFDAIASGDLTGEELSKALQTHRYQLVASAATTSSLNATMVNLVTDGQPLDAYRQRLASLDQISLDMVNETARAGLFDWSSYLILIVGDRSTVEAQLEEAGFARPVMADAEGKLLE
jgi:predicted Zn-dependent peptidase